MLKPCIKHQKLIFVQNNLINTIKKALTVRVFTLLLATFCSKNKKKLNLLFRTVILLKKANSCSFLENSGHTKNKEFCFQRALCVLMRFILKVMKPNLPLFSIQYIIKEILLLKSQST